MENNYLLIECRSFSPLIAAVDEVLKSTNLNFITYKRYGSAYNTAVFNGKHSSCLNGREIAVETVKNICQQIPSQNIIKAGVSRLISTKVINSPDKNIIDFFFSKDTRIGKFKTNKLKEQNYDSLLFLDSRGLIALITAADQLTDDFPLEIIDCKKMGSGRLTLILAGKIDVLKLASAAAKEIIIKQGKYIGSSLIANVDQQIVMSL
ncbi:MULTISPECIES: BMC domain-containing protein [Halanaerobium]|uniref:BMC domain-containing protein n=1 Tax=Halanaerobium kushneri TaxID=56779 RepID=A0A1N6QUM0_9FIRM|nr:MULTISPECIES: BMC domain-containing protein [Halanaerobium]RCW61072.1 BMC domain-containing protein [Halanaerobium sp. ST460_2HS_T2]SIQ20279.1 BMC domain-containing protein [Halanaerobium kushneri]